MILITTFYSLNWRHHLRASYVRFKKQFLCCYFVRPFSSWIETLRLQNFTSYLIFKEQTYSSKTGGDDRSRTCDPLRAKQMLSQLSYTPKKYFVSVYQFLTSKVKRNLCDPIQSVKPFLKKTLKIFLSLNFNQTNCIILLNY